MLQELLSHNGEYALALGPGFFCFYAQLGILCALEELKIFHPSHVSGSSAGAIIGGFISSGIKPAELVQLLFKLKREDIWDVGAFTGLLKGQLVHEKLES
jgi:NTE family protein